MQELKNKKLISVLLPTYQPNEGYFVKCIESILSQTYSNFELIISDDSSSDVVEKLLEKYNDDRIKYIRNQGGKGIFQNLNHAAKISTGNFIQIFCQDDYMYKGMLEKQVVAMNKFQDAGFVYAQYEAINGEGKVTIPGNFSGRPENELYFVPQQKATNLFFKYGCLPGNLSTVMLRREVLDEMGGFDEKTPFVGDFKYWVEVTKKYGFAIVRPPMLAVRTHSMQASQTMGGVKWIEEVLPIYQELYQGINIGESKRLARLFINEKMGVQGLYIILKSFFLTKKIALLKRLKLLNKEPFSLGLIVVLFIATLRQKLSYFKLNNVVLFED